MNRAYLSRPWSAAGRRWRRRRLAAVAGLAALAMPLSVAAVPLGPAQAQPAGPPAAVSGQPPTAAGMSGAAGEAHEITLVTGDRVELTMAGPGGGYSVDVDPANRPSGETVTFLTQAGPDGVYVLPSDAMPAIQAGHLDRELFHVSGLVQHGLADADSAELPVIVSYREPAGAASRGFVPDAADLTRRTGQLPGTGEPVGLASINGAAATVAKDQAGAFWHQLRGTPAPADARVAGGPAGLAGEVATVWLDRTAELVLNESVPLVGAPQAWDAGYDGTGVTVAVLDSGVDLNHPDLADRVVAAESFVDGAPPQDGHGHGTHVASTIAGTGAASDGRRTGVAPGAELVTGRVCTDAGQCPFSAMIAGMEWAAGPMDARVVSMSIGGAVTDGTDPLSQAVDSLTASSGALFVVAAGNNGDDVTVASPGAADAALTVAATDKQDRLAGFSSRGPRFGDLALKPDIAAPGVAIVAARAAGTSMGSPVDDWYTSAQGTSMATPHVSGAAAIVAQRHPDWSPAQLKAALMSTAADAGHTVYQQGAGRLDAGRAATQQLVATTANLDFGIVPIGPDGQPDPGPVTREISYRNLGEQPVTLSLAPALATTDGTPAPAGALVSDATVTVPAAGTATVAVTLDPSGLGEGTYTGAVVATEDASGIRLTTPVGLVREPPKFTLTVHTLDRAGEPRSPWAQDTLRLDGPGGPVAGVRLVDEGTTAVRVPAGTYSLTQAVDWVDAESRANTALLLRPELVVAGDTEITLDLRQAEQVSFSTPRPSEPLNNASAMAYQRTTQLDETFAGVLDTISATRLWATPTEQVDTGRFRFWTQALLGQAEVALTVLGPDGAALHPAAPQHWSYPLGDGSGGEHLVQDGHPGWVPFTGTQDLPLVDAGDGSTEALAGLDLAGKLALMEADGTFDNPFGAAACGIDILKIQNVRDAGAAGLVAFPSPDHVCAPLPIPLRIVQEQFTGPPKEVGIPNVHVSTQEGLDLRAELAAGPVAVRVVGTPETPYSYVLKPYEEGRVPESLQYTLTDQQLAEVALDFHAPRATTYIEHRSVWKPDDLVKDALHLSDHGAPAFVGPQRRTEYFGPVSREVLHTRSGFGRQGGLEPEGYRHRWQRASFPEIFDQPGQARQQWYVAPKAPGARTGSEDVYQLIGPDAVQTLGMCTLCRQSGILLTHLPLVTGGPGSWQHDLGAGSSAFLAEEGFFDLDFRLFRDGAEIAPLPGLPWAVFPMPAAPASYRMTAHGTQTEVTWTFTSSEPVEDTRRPGHTCFMETFFGSTDPCAPEPIVFASYDLAGSLELDNTVPALGAQRFSVTAYHSPSTAPMPAIAGLKLSVSYDGEQWSPARVRPAGNGRFDVTLVHPPARHRASDQVSLRVEAWDAAGNRIEQITRDAFTLSD